MTDTMTSSEILDADAMLRAAQDETGLKDWGDDTLPDRFRMAVDLIKGQAMDDRVVKSPQDASQGQKPGVTRYVLTIGLTLVVILFAVAYVISV